MECRVYGDTTATVSWTPSQARPIDCALGAASQPLSQSIGWLAPAFRRLSRQTGLATLMKGMFSTFRNPTAHAPKVVWATSRADALDMLTLVSMLHRRLDDATVR